MIVNNNYILAYSSEQILELNMVSIKMPTCYNNTSMVISVDLLCNIA